MSCRFDRKPGNSYIYVEFPGFLIRRNQEGCEKRRLFRGRTWRKCYYFVYKKLHVSVGQKSRIQHHNGPESTLSQFCEQTAMDSAGRCGGRSEGPSRGAPGLLWWWGTPRLCWPVAAGATGFSTARASRRPWVRRFTRMTGSPEGTRGTQASMALSSRFPRREQSSMFCSWPVSMWPTWISMWMPSS